MKLKNSFQMIDILGERAYNISTRIGGDYMLDVNMIIANNIQAELKKENKKQVDLAEGIAFLLASFKLCSSFLISP